MPKFHLFALLLPLCLLPGCAAEPTAPAPAPPTPADLYFPPARSDQWETITPAEAGWDAARLPALYDFLEANGTRAFLVLKDGKLMTEQYWGRNILNTSSFTAGSAWYWASAGKSLIALLVGHAQLSGSLDIDSPTANYLGAGWTSLTPERESAITVRHQLTMTTGLDYRGNLNCTDPACLTYKAPPGTEWYYFNGPYTLLSDVLSAATGVPYADYTDRTLAATGIEGTWRNNADNRVFWSTARSAARFGLLILNGGRWADEPALISDDYFRAMTAPSQALNPSYGYLWWLNGQSSIVFPGSPAAFPTSFSPSAPADLIVAAGKNGQFIDVVPSRGLVVIRLGEAPGESLVPAAFHEELWRQIAALSD